MWLHMVVNGGGNFTVKVACLPAPLLERLLVEGMSGNLADSTRQLVHTTALLLLLELHSSGLWFSVSILPFNGLLSFPC